MEVGALVPTKETALLIDTDCPRPTDPDGPEAISATVASIATALAKKISMHKEQCKAMILDNTYETRRGMLSSLKDLIKTSATEDPNMCKPVKTAIEKAVDVFWSEIEEELERDLEAAVLNQLAAEDVKGPSAGGRWLEWYWQLRAFVLYHYFPNNKSFFGKLRDPVYVCILSLSLAPVSGLRFVIFFIILFFLWTPGPPDEFMLANFIMIFKGFQFLSTGILKTGWAAAVYFYCLSSEEVMDARLCATSHGPESATYLSLLADYVGNVLLTYCAWCSLKCAVSPQNRYLLDEGRRDPAKRGDELLSPKSPNTSGKSPRSWRHSGKLDKRKGGLFNRLMYYDLCCFLFSVVILVVLTVAFCNPPHTLFVLMADAQFRTNVFWSNVTFSLTTLPFLPLNIPWVFSVFTRTSPTGFNRNGACVAFRIAVLEMKRRRRGWFPSATSAIKSVADFGRSKRKGLTGDALYTEGETGYTDTIYDFSYGLYRAVIFAEMDSQEAAEIPADMVPSPDQLMTSWDRF